MTPTGETLHLERYFDVNQERVFQAWASSESLSTWFGLGGDAPTTATVDFREGGTYVLEANGYVVRGIYQKIHPYDAIVFTWKWDDDQDVPDMLVSLSFESTQTGTKMTLLHERIADMARLEQHRAGWEVALERLASTLQA